MTWRVLTWNLHGSADPDLSAIAERLGAAKVDVAALQEVRRSQARRLARLLGWRVVWRRKHYPYSPLVWWRAEGLAIASPHPVEHPVGHTLSTGEPIWIYRHRVMLSATVRRTGESLAVHDLHLASDDADARIDQARRAARLIALRRDAARVVCGDLNAHDEPEVLREFHAVDVRDPGGDSTSPAHAPRQRLDYVLVPATAVGCTVSTPDGGDDWSTLSDHLPVIVEF